METPAIVRPSDQTLQSYGLGKLDDVQSEAVGKRIEECAAYRDRGGGAF
jgi:hypothetical protein